MELTASEKEMIKLNREKEEIAAREKALEDQVKYDGYLRQQSEYIDKESKILDEGSERMKSAYQILIGFGVNDHISINIKEKTIECNYVKDKLKPEDYIVKNHPYCILSTKWGDIYSIRIDMKMQLPFQLSSRYQNYKLETVAQKIKDRVSSELRTEQEKNTKDNYISELISQFKKQSPEGTKFEKDTKWIHQNYGHSRGYKVNTLRIEYPNGSWLLIQCGFNSWTILEKFDSKYIKPETKEEWLIYLSK